MISGQTAYGVSRPHLFQRKKFWRFICFAFDQRLNLARDGPITVHFHLWRLSRGQLKRTKIWSSLQIFSAICERYWLCKEPRELISSGQRLNWSPSFLTITIRTKTVKRPTVKCSYGACKNDQYHAKRSFNQFIIINGFDKIMLILKWRECFFCPWYQFLWNEFSMAILKVLSLFNSRTGQKISSAHRSNQMWWWLSAHISRIRSDDDFERT